jgi:hypothetical protein
VDELLRIVDEMIAYFGAAGEMTPQSGVIALPCRHAYRLTQARKALREVRCIPNCKCRGKGHESS